MALAGALHTFRSSLLARISLPVNRLQAVGAAASLSLVRGFAESQYLDKDVVTERVLQVVKNFDKVDPSKVCHATEGSGWVVDGLPAWRGDQHKQGRSRSMEDTLCVSIAVGV